MGSGCSRVDCSSIDGHSLESLPTDVISFLKDSNFQPENRLGHLKYKLPEGWKILKHLIPERNVYLFLNPEKVPKLIIIDRINSNELMDVKCIQNWNDPQLKLTCENITVPLPEFWIDEGRYIKIDSDHPLVDIHNDIREMNTRYVRLFTNYDLNSALLERTRYQVERESITEKSRFYELFKYNEFRFVAENFVQGWPYSPREVFVYLSMHFYRACRKTPQQRQDDHTLDLLNEARKLFQHVIHFKLTNEEIVFEATQDINDILEIVPEYRESEKLGNEVNN